MNYISLTNKPFAVSSKKNYKAPVESKEQLELRKSVEEIEVIDCRGNRTYCFK